VGWELQTCKHPSNSCNQRSHRADRQNRGAFYFVGGMLEIFCGILEFFLGNTFPFVVFTSYGQSTDDSKETHTHS